MKEKTISKIADIKEIVVPILERHNAKRAGLFGSVVRGEIRRTSDIDILVQLEVDLSLLDVIGIEQELEDALGRKVDLVEYDAIKPLIKDQILAEEVRIL